MSPKSWIDIELHCIPAYQGKSKYGNGPIVMKDLKVTLSEVFSVKPVSDYNGHHPFNHGIRAGSHFLLSVQSGGDVGTDTQFIGMAAGAQGSDSFKNVQLNLNM